MTNKTTTKTTTQLPMDLIDMDAYKALEQSGLKQSERELVAVFLMTNKLGHSTQSRITTLCGEGKAGHKSIISMAKWLKTQGQDTATIKTQVNRAMTKLKTGLSLQGLGKDQQVTIAPKQDQKGGKDKATDSDTDTLTIQYDNDSFDQSAFDMMFMQWDIETQKYFIEHCIQLKAKGIKAQKTRTLKSA